MANREVLHERLVSILGSERVYYQAPPTKDLSYPCIIYSLSGIDSDHADDEKYRVFDRYKVILIEKRPDSPRVKALNRLPYSSLNATPYTTDNLYHYPFTIYF